MLQPPDQFQRRVYVRLPHADRYLTSPQEARKIRAELKQAFANPILKVSITPDETTRLIKGKS